jgi:hypothetical protein
MVEPLEETRSEITFATEPVLCSLSLAIPGSPGARASPVELDEIEVRTVFNAGMTKFRDLRGSLDSEGCAATLQGIAIPAYVRSHDPLQPRARQCHHQQRCECLPSRHVPMPGSRLGTFRATGSWAD